MVVKKLIQLVEKLGKMTVDVENDVFHNYKWFENKIWRFLWKYLKSF